MLTSSAHQPELVELTKAEQTVHGVMAAALGNLLAGVGVGLVAGVLLHIAGATPATYMRWGALVGLLFWGFIMAVWFSQDEARNWWARRELALDLAAAEEAMDEADAEILRLREECRTLRAENAQLRVQRDAAGGRTYVAAGAVEDRTVADARALIRHQAETGRHPGKRDASELWGWSEARHASAMRRLRDAGIVDVRGTQPAWVRTGAEATAALNHSVSLAWLGDAAKPTGENRQAPSQEGGAGGE